MLEQIENILLSGLSSVDFINAFLAVFFLGESAVITVVVAAKQGLMDLHIVIIAATIATFSADLFWLLVGRFAPQHRLPKKLKKNILGPINEMLAKLVDKNLFFTLICLKFLITIRLPLLLHLSRYPISWFRLLAYDLIGTLIFIFSLTVVAIKFESYISENLEGGEIIVTILSVIAVIFIVSKLALKILLRWALKSG